jgi:hypothetical protein
MVKVRALSVRQRVPVRAVVLAVALATEAGAGATNLPRQPPGRDTVAQCAARVRAATPGSVFGAYIDPRTGDLRWFGSEQERSHFSRCLALHGASEQPTPKGVTK